MRVILPHGRSFHRGFPAFGGIGQTATKLVITTQPSATPSTGMAFAQQPVIQLQDASNSPVLQSGVTVTATRSSGSDTLGGTLTAVTDNSGLATFTNLMFTGTAGSDAITFSASGLTSVTSNPINPASGDAEPVFDAGVHTQLWTDDTNYTDFANVVAGGHWVTDSGGTALDTSTDPAGSQMVISGTGRGSGKAIALQFHGIANGGTSDQEGHTWGRMIGNVLAGKPGHTLYIQYYMRLVPGGGFTLDDNYPTPNTPAVHIIKNKGLEIWNHDQSSRLQFNFSFSTTNNDVPVAGSSGSGTLFQLFGTGSEPATGTPHCGQVRPPFAYQLQNQWVRCTYEVVTQTAPGARDGVGRMWYDGTLIVAARADYIDVVVPGGLGHDFFYEANGPEKWCKGADLDNWFTDDYYSKINLGGVHTAALWPYRQEWTDFSVWIKT